MFRYLSCPSIVVAALLLAACGGGDSSTDASATGNGLPTLTGLEGQLAAIVLQPTDVPEGLDASAPSFTTNDELAGSNQETLATLVRQGRQLGVSVQFIPTDRLDPSSPLRGGIESAASVYLSSLGAGESYETTAADALGNDWEANYPDILDMHVTEVPRTFGDQSLWLRIAGNDCQTNVTAPATPRQACTEEQHLVILDNVILRVGRVRAYLQVITRFPADAAPDVFQEEISAWATTVVERAGATFPSG